MTDAHLSRFSNCEIDGIPALQNRVLARLLAAHDAGDDLVTSDLTLAECLVEPIRNNDHLKQAAYQNFLNQTLSVDHPHDAFLRLARIRAATNHRIPDALHLATAIHHQCDLFLTNDHRLAGFAGINVEVLP